MSDKPQLTKENKEFFAMSVAEGIANLEPVKGIADKLKLSERQVRNVMKTDEYKEVLDELKTSAKAKAKAFVSRRANRLMPQAMAALEKALEEGSIEGVKLVFKTFGVVDDKTDESSQDKSVNIILPSFKKEKYIETASKDKTNK